MMNSRSTPKGGRPPKHGGTAKPQLNIKGRRYADTPANRKRFGLPLSGSDRQVPGSKPPETPPAETKPAGPGDPFAANEAEVRRMLGAGGPVPGAASPGQPAQPVQPAEIQISYAEVVKVVNTFLTAYVAQYAMTAQEETAIGTALDAVIVKHFPALRNAGPEFALALALLGYVVRVFIVPMLKDKLPGIQLPTEAPPGNGS